jgi:hypothetical protein
MRNVSHSLVYPLQDEQSLSRSVLADAKTMASSGLNLLSTDPLQATSDYTAALDVYNKMHILHYPRHIMAGDNGGTACHCGKWWMEDGKG